MITGNSKADYCIERSNISGLDFEDETLSEESVKKIIEEIEKEKFQSIVEKVEDGIKSINFCN